MKTGIYLSRLVEREVATLLGVPRASLSRIGKLTTLPLDFLVLLGLAQALPLCFAAPAHWYDWGRLVVGACAALAILHDGAVRVRDQRAS